MASQKQKILGAIVKHGYVHLRGQFYLSWKESLFALLKRPRRFRYNQQLANLMHRIGETTHTSEFTDLDFSFLNHAVPRFLESPGNCWDKRLLQLLVDLHDSVPNDCRHRVSWHPPAELRSLK